MAAPRLPDDTIFGELNTSRSGRAMSAIDASPIGEGMQQVARAGMRAGSQFAGIAQSLQAEAEAGRNKDDDLKDAENRAAFQSEKIKLDSLRDNERDPEKLAQFPSQYQALQQKYASSYSDPVRQRKFLAYTMDDVAKGEVASASRKQAWENENYKADGLSKLEQYRKDALEAEARGDKEAAGKMVEAGNGIFAEWAKRGILDPTKAVEVRKNWATSYAIDALKLLPPEQRAAAVGGWKEALKARESSGNPRIENQLGYAGSYQFGAPRLETLGVYTPGANEDMAGWSKSGKTAPGKWSGQFNIPGFPEVKTKSDFLANPDAQEAVFAIHTKKMDQEIAAQGLDKYIGQTVGGVPITREGIYAMMHLGGAGGAALALKSGGVINNKDANNTSLLDYAKMGAAGPSRLAGILDPVQRKQIVDEAHNELLRQSEQSAKIALANASAVEAEAEAKRNALYTSLYDGTAGQAEIIAARRDGLLTSYEDIKKADGIYEQKAKEGENERAFVGAWQANGQKLDYMNKDHKDIAEAGVNLLVKGAEANGQTLSKADAGVAIHHKLGILPASAITAMRGDLESNDPDRLGRTAKIIGNLMSNPGPSPFVGNDNREKLETLGVTFNHYTQGLGLPDKEAVQKIIQENTPEAKRAIKVTDAEAKAFREDLEKNALRDMKAASLPGSGWLPFTSNSISDTTKGAIAQDYAELAALKYKETQNADVAKSYAKTQIAKLYGVSGPDKVVIKYPPELSPAYPPVDGKHDYIYEQAKQRVQDVAGVKADKVWLQGVDDNRAGGAFNAGQRVPYQVIYQYKKDGQTVHDVLYHDPREGFRADPEKARAAVSAKREAEMKGNTQPTFVVDEGTYFGGNPRTPEAKAELKANVKKIAEDKRAAAARENEQIQQERQQRFAEDDARRAANEAKRADPNADHDPLGVKAWIKNTPKNPLKGFVPGSPRNSKLPE